MSTPPQNAEPPSAVAPELHLELVPQEPRFVIRLPGRIPRVGSTPIQLALPRLFHYRLRVSTSGSLNHALIALVRLAFSWLDADEASLRIRTEFDPLMLARHGPPAELQATGAEQAGPDAPTDWSLPHPAFTTLKRDAKVLVEVQGRPSRHGIVFLQVGLPSDIQQRLHEQGLGSTSQLVVYLARYAFMRLLTMKLSLHVTVTDGSSSGLPPTVESGYRRGWSAPIESSPISTIGQLIKCLQAYPLTTPVGMADTGFDANSAISGVSLVRTAIGKPSELQQTLFLIGDFQQGVWEYLEELGLGEADDS